MTDHQGLYFVALLVWFLESLHRVRIDTLVTSITVLTGTRFRAAAASAWLRNETCAFSLAAADPSGLSILSPAWPFSFSLTHLSAATPATPDRDAIQEPTPAIVAFDEVSEFDCEGTDLRADGRLFIKTDSIDHSRLLVALLEAVRVEKDRGKRSEILARALERSLDFDAARNEIAHLRRETLVLRIFGAAYFLFIFGALTCVAFLPLPIMLLPFLIGYVTLIIANQIVFGLTHARLRPGHVAERVFQIFNCIVPFHPARSTDIITRPALASFHPLAVLGALFDGRALADAIRPHVRAAWFPKPDHEAAGEAEREAQHYFLRAWRLALERYLAKLDLEIGELLATPTAPNIEANAFCPRCESFFRSGGDRCADCGIDKVPLAAAATAMAG